MSISRRHTAVNKIILSVMCCKYIIHAITNNLHQFFRQCFRRCLERHGRIWCHDGHTPAVLASTTRAILHANETKEVHSAFPKPNRKDGEEMDDYQARLKKVKNPRFPGCFYPQFVSFSGGVCMSLRDKRVVGRYLRLVHGKGTNGDDTFRKGMRQMETFSLSLLLAAPVDSPFNGYSSLDVTTIR